MTDAEILAAMRAKKAEADLCEQQQMIAETQANDLRLELHALWQEIHRLHNALLRPDPTL